jgi:hypothetical protein
MYVDRVHEESCPGIRPSTQILSPNFAAAATPPRAVAMSTCATIHGMFDSPVFAMPSASCSSSSCRESVTMAGRALLAGAPRCHPWESGARVCVRIDDGRLTVRSERTTRIEYEFSPGSGSPRPSDGNRRVRIRSQYFKSRPSIFDPRATRVYRFIVRMNLIVALDS